jgi:putative transposase
MAQGYRVGVKEASADGASVRTLVTDELDRWVREGARRMIATMLEAEVNDFLQRARYQRGDDARGYRNGYAPERTIGVGVGAIPIRQPRVSDVPDEIATDGFHSQIVPRYQRLSTGTQHLLTRLYLEGISTGDFEPVFRSLLGETAPLSPSSIVRLKAEWQTEFTAWQKRRLDHERYVYCWVDGIYLAAGQEDEKTALLCVLGLRADGQKELLALGLGYRESTESWKSVLRDLRERGMHCPLLMIGDGALGIWAALGEVWPTCRRQRCWNHRVINVLDQLPKRLWHQLRVDLRKAATAASRADAGRQLESIATELRHAGQAVAAETVLRDLDDFLTFYDFPQEHWIHLRTTNPIESIFAGVRLRTDVTKRAPNRENAQYLVFQLIERLSQNWRRISGSNLTELLLRGERFVDGKLFVEPQAA